MAMGREERRKKAREDLKPLLTEIFNKGSAQAVDKMPDHYLTVSFGYYAGKKHADKPDFLLIGHIVDALSLDHPFDDLKEKILGGRLGGVLKEACDEHATIRAVEIDIYPEWMEVNVDEEAGETMAQEVASLIRDRHFQSMIAANLGFKIRTSNGEEADLTDPWPVHKI